MNAGAYTAGDGAVSIARMTALAENISLFKSAIPVTSFGVFLDRRKKPNAWRVFFVGADSCAMKETPNPGNTVSNHNPMHP
jgi:hypothetical protein